MLDFGHSVIRLAKVSSVDFVEKVFKLYQAKELFVIGGTGLDLSLPGEVAVNDVMPNEGGGWFQLNFQQDLASCPAQIIFSSGTEGTPKAIVLSQLNLASVTERINSAMAIDSSIKEYIGVPVTYSFGLGRCRAIAAVGGRGYIPPAGFNVLELASMIEKGEVNAISAVPTLWRLVLSNQEVLRGLGDKIKWIEIGSQFMSAEEKVSMRTLFPCAKIVQHYGLTEASRTTLLNISDSPEAQLSSVGSVSEDINIKTNEEGRILIKGANVALGVLVEGRLDSLINDEGWLVTKDLGSIKDGCLYYEGRADDVVNCAGVKVDPDIVQQGVNNEQAEDAWVYVCAVDDKERGQAFFLATTNESADLKLLSDRAHDVLKTLGVPSRDAIKAQVVEQIPRTETGKLRRKKLSKLYKPRPSKAQQPKHQTDVFSLFQSFFPGEAICAKDTFSTLGGDSLNFIQLSIALEKLIGPLPTGWENQSIESLRSVNKNNKTPIGSYVDMGVFLRALAIMGVVASHAGVGIVAGGTTLLFVLIGYNLARFQSASYLAGHAWKNLLPYLTTILIPYFLFVGIYMSASQTFDLSQILLVGNFSQDMLLTLIFPFWFVQVLVQSMLIFALLFSIAPISKALSEKPWLSSYVVLLFFLVAYFVFSVLGGKEAYGGSTFIAFLPIIWLGWTLAKAQRSFEKVISCLTGLAFAYSCFGTHSKTVWVALACLCLPWVSVVVFPKVIKRILETVGAATFHIYVLNGMVIYIVMYVLHIESAWVSFFVGLASGIGSWLIFSQWTVTKQVFGKIGRLVNRER